ncbi:MAG: molybdopterin molybdenumtransferase MoeA [Rhodanobacter sp.]|nr:MAG: molybdopterin molybdenumtransferase MoeA [Rhodanobacter sp.]
MTTALPALTDYTTARDQLLAHSVRCASEPCPLAQAAGRILALDIRSPMALPSFDHAAMDGYALCARNALAAGSEHRVQGSQAAGDVAVESTGAAWEIMTGAQLPDGLDAVVAVERTELLETLADGSPARIRLSDPLVAGQNVRYAGTDVEQGAVVLRAGIRIGPAQVMLLAALGIASVEVVRRPRAAIICTGKELQADASMALQSGRIHGSNGPYLVAALDAIGVLVLSCETVDDTAVTYAAALQRAVDAGAELVISTGAVSMGRYDFVPDSLRRLGAEILFHRVAMRPGKPLLAAALPQGPLLLALPGTPMAVAAGLRFFVTPVVRAMSGQEREPLSHAVLDTPQRPTPGLRHFLRASFRQDESGSVHASVLKLQQPFRIQPFADADGWVVLPENAGDCAAGSMVRIASLHTHASSAFLSARPIATHEEVSP